MLKVIFLDFDGVLNNEEDFEFWRENGVHPDDRLCSKKVAILNRIIAKTGAKVVISSTWRIPHVPNISPLKEILERRGFVGDIIGLTPVNGKSRLSEITDFMDSVHVDDFVIIDDLDVFAAAPLGLKKLRDKFFFQTDDTIGLTNDIADRIIKRLNG